MSDSEELDSVIDEGVELDSTAPVGGEQYTEDDLLGDSSSDDKQTASSGEDSDDEDETDYDEDEEVELINKYIEVLGKIKEDKYNYDNYVELVETA